MKVAPRLLLLAACVVVSLALACGPTLRSLPAHADSEHTLVEAPLAIRASPPSFSLDDLAGERHDLSGAPAAPVLVHFFATWCEPCREELPALQRLSARGRDVSLAVYAISVGEPDIRVRRFFEPMDLGFPVLLDRDKAVAKTWQVATLPTTYVLDRERRPRLLVEGEFEWDRLGVQQLLGAISSRGD